MDLGQVEGHFRRQKIEGTYSGGGWLGAKTVRAPVIATGTRASTKNGSWEYREMKWMRRSLRESILDTQHRGR